MKSLFFLLFTFFINNPLYAVDMASLPFQGEDLFSEQALSIGENAKKPLVLVFLSATCPCSDSHIPELKKLEKDYPNFDFIGLHANLDESPSLAKDYFKEKNISFPIVRDREANIANQLKALKTPHAFVIQPEGKIVYQGGVTSSSNAAKAKTKYLRQALEDLTSNKKIRMAQGRTLGCAIRR